MIKCKEIVVWNMLRNEWVLSEEEQNTVNKYTFGLMESNLLKGGCGSCCWQRTHWEWEGLRQQRWQLLHFFFRDWERGLRSLFLCYPIYYIHHPSAQVPKDFHPILSFLFMSGYFSVKLKITCLRYWDDFFHQYFFICIC